MFEFGLCAFPCHCVSKSSVLQSDSRDASSLLCNFSSQVIHLVAEGHGLFELLNVRTAVNIVITNLVFIFCFIPV